MNKTNAHHYLPHVRDLAEGHTLQANRGTDEAPRWEDLDANDGEVLFTCAPDKYRRKPE